MIVNRVFFQKKGGLLDDINGSLLVEIDEFDVTILFIH